jgi:hypothetical protein
MFLSDDLTTQVGAFALLNSNPYEVPAEAAYHGLTRPC